MPAIEEDLPQSGFEGPPRLDHAQVIVLAVVELLRPVERGDFLPRQLRHLGHTVLLAEPAADPPDDELREADPSRAEPSATTGAAQATCETATRSASFAERYRPA